MYLSLDEKRFTFYVNYFSIISLCNLSNVPMARINSVKFSIDPVTKISSTEFTFFGQGLPEYSFRENFCPYGDRTLQLE